MWIKADIVSRLFFKMNVLKNVLIEVWMRANWALIDRNYKIRGKPKSKCSKLLNIIKELFLVLVASFSTIKHFRYPKIRIQFYTFVYRTNWFIILCSKINSLLSVISVCHWRKWFRKVKLFKIEFQKLLSKLIGQIILAFFLWQLKI